jgi:ATP-dependent DNA helicase
MRISLSPNRFNFPTRAVDDEIPSAESILSESHSQHVITSLHGILKPFLLRRIKADVEVDLPPKKEYILYAPLTRPQVDIYEVCSF